MDTINAAGMSLEEYNWIRAQILLTLGHGFAAVDFAAQNLETLQPYLEDAEDWLPLSFFGL